MGIRGGLNFSCLVNICHVNLNCLINKINLVSNFLSSYNIDVLGVSESWLTSDIPDSFVAISGYHIVRSDNPSLVKKHGVAIYIRNSINYLNIPSGFKNLAVVFLVDFGIYIMTVYRPPSYNTDENVALMEFLVNFCSDKEVLVQGDFNLPSLLWQTCNPIENYTLPVDRLFFDCFSDIGFTQVVEEATNFPSCTTLDLCLVTHAERICSCYVLPPLPACSHGAVRDVVWVSWGWQMHFQEATHFRKVLIIMPILLNTEGYGLEVNTASWLSV